MRLIWSWVPLSPALQTWTWRSYCPGTCLLERHNLSEERTAAPFPMVGTLCRSHALARELQSQRGRLIRLYFTLVLEVCRPSVRRGSIHIIDGAYSLLNWA